ncbi:MAG: type III-A CRISPR-associated protein Csm2 [Firmicutes bacterium]|nr:type III-A CRISPR-associated protein Csm2 [Bacillota bacterium]
MQEESKRKNTANMNKKIDIYDMLSSENYVDQAEKIIKELKEREEKDKKDKKKRPADKFKLVTTSQLRNILDMVMNIYNQVISEKQDELSEDVINRIQYLKVKMIYNAGKENSVKVFIDESGLMKYIDHIGSSRKNYILFTRYMEALVAYRKYVGGDKEIG